MASPPGDRGMNRHYLRATVAAASRFGTLFVAVAWLAPAPRLLWNASASARIGLYRIDPGATSRAGELVAILPSPPLGAWLVERLYVPASVPLLMGVEALHRADRKSGGVGHRVIKRVDRGR